MTTVMRFDPTVRRAALAALSLLALPLGAQPVRKEPAPAGPDPRIGLAAGWSDAKEAIRNLELLSHRDRTQGFCTP